MVVILVVTIVVVAVVVIRVALVIAEEVGIRLIRIVSMTRTAMGNSTKGSW